MSNLIMLGFSSVCSALLNSMQSIMSQNMQSKLTIVIFYFLLLRNVPGSSSVPCALLNCPQYLKWLNMLPLFTKLRTFLVVVFAQVISKKSRFGQITTNRFMKEQIHWNFVVLSALPVLITKWF